MDVQELGILAIYPVPPSMHFLHAEDSRDVKPGARLPQTAMTNFAKELKVSQATEKKIERLFSALQGLWAGIRLSSQTRELNKLTSSGWTKSLTLISPSSSRGPRFIGDKYPWESVALIKNTHLNLQGAIYAIVTTVRRFWKEFQWQQSLSSLSNNTANKFIHVKKSKVSYRPCHGYMPT